MMDKSDEREKYRQRARRPRAQQASHGSKISDDIADAFDLIPEIGNGYRWYDWPYRALWWLAGGWRRKVLPRRVRSWLNNGINWLLPFNEHDRDWVERLDSWMHNIEAPADEHVTATSYWVVELFPPTDLPKLEAALRENGWNARNRFSPSEERNREVLERSRSGVGASWWRLIDIFRPDSTWGAINGVHQKLPDQFEYVEMSAVQVGTGLTAVIAEFHLRDEAMHSLDAEWHKQHDPLLMWERPRPRSLDRHWATIHQVQGARREMHYSARDWLSKKLPGFFARTKHPQPLLDLLLFDEIDPVAPAGAEGDREARIREIDALRALGIERPAFHRLTSPSLPKLILQPPHNMGLDPLANDPTWTLWGKRDEVVAALEAGSLDGYGSDQNRAIANRLVDNMANVFLMVAVSSFLAITEERFAKIRDRASSRHGKFRPRAIRQLRQSFLTLSLDLASVQRDVATFWERSWRWEGDAEFSYVRTPDEAARAQNEGEKGKENASIPASFNDELKDHHEASFARLQAADRNYRDILSTVASLGSSADSFRTGRLALSVSIVSLFVATVTVLVSDLSEGSIFALLLVVVQRWLGIKP